MIDKNTIELTNAKGEKNIITSDKILIAVGGRPNYPQIDGAREFCITSDDLFSLKKAPGKTLIIGASYIALVKKY
jgi:thioredoxin reductase (NADPH)